MADEVLERMSEDVIGAMRGFVIRSLGPLMTRIEALEKRAPEKGERGDAGKDGESVDMVSLSSSIVEAAYAAATKAVESMPKPKDGLPGKDYDSLVLKEVVAAEVAKIPKPENGKDGTDGRDGIDGKAGDAGKDADAEEIAKSVLVKVSEVLDSIPVPKDGEKGDRGEEGKKGDAGKDADPAFIQSEIERQVKALPPPERGPQGERGVAGEVDPEVMAALVAKAVEDSLPELVTKAQEILSARVAQAEAEIPKMVDKAQAALAEQLSKAVSSIPIPKDGKDADQNVMRTQIVEELSRLPPPLPGKDADPETIRYEIAKQLSTIPKGNDGEDGFSLDDFDVEAKDEGRILVFKFHSNGREKVREIKTGMPIYRGTYKTGDYEAGDTMTYGGSLWLAKRDTSATPGNGNADWQLIVKRGQDAK